ncbi:hypothetical protein [uncultured Psychrobacter sp.]|uniref:hypothetical protein n=1 Tax=uncultured Psychrobacter sp. TaxID=259303 RepID=UPI0025915C73|nr:hypothetical protein [uncultured Psychrobacter sp.]
MKIVHLCLASFYIDDASYQENILPRYHKKAGYEVEIIASPDIFDKTGKLIIGEASKEYYNEDNILVKRLKYKIEKTDKKLKRFHGLYESLIKSNPDIIFIHGCQFLDIFNVIKYLETSKKTRVFVDNHADFSNSASNLLSRYILHRVLWKTCAQAILPYTEKFYGVLPSRVDFLHKEYKIPKNKINLLVMGADDDYVTSSIEKSRFVRDKFDISSDSFLIVTGGKIDSAKVEVLDLMQSVNELCSDNDVKLIVFGSVTPEILNDFNSLLSSNVIHAGWITPESSYSYFAAADLVVFPGRHSVFWEQVVAQKKPLMVKLWPGTTHIDIGGNVIFLKRSNKQEIKEKLEKVLRNPNFMKNLQSVASSSKSEDFLYSKIAYDSLQSKQKV